jgi:hypothetical protein
MTNEPCTKIVIDAANLIHDDRGIEKTDENGEHIIQMIPQRLVSAIEHCQEKGYEVVALLKGSTYKRGLREFKANNPDIVGYESIIDLKEKGTIKIIKSNNDDMYIVEYGLKENALILTRDWFNDHREERPDLDWETVDTIRTNQYEFIDNSFISPNIRDISSSLPKQVRSDPVVEFRGILDAQDREIQSLKERVHELEERDITKEIHSMSEKEIQQSLKEAKKDSSRSKSPKACAEAYLRLAGNETFCKPKKKTSLLNDLKSRGLASEMGVGIVMHHLQQLKAIHVHKKTVEWRV